RGEGGDILHILLPRVKTRGYEHPTPLGSELLQSSTVYTEVPDEGVSPSKFEFRISDIGYQSSFFTFFACPKKVTKKGHPRTRFELHDP
ncbi:MAG: hypothetical protein DRI24_19230, partial [Deltaproteobacteria bacterium]